ncbi:MAG: RHS repeat-associated core domain-containing protein [Parachlamydiaceae bacterium]|nr:RHS repeat-associated core domain-containing protein [Parachlamydiaceae bacterium]
MNNIKYFLILILNLIFSNLHATNHTPNPLVNSVNVVTGKADDPTYTYEYYTAGRNDVDGRTIDIPKGDSRIGKIKLQKKKHDQSNQVLACFFYNQGYTEVLDALKHKSIYRYSKKNCVEAVEHYTSTSEPYQLYRKERLFWDSSTERPKLISRVLEDAQGQAQLACLFYYNKQWQLVRETLVGNLSGSSDTPLIIRSNGLPENGSETYSIKYKYDLKNPDLLIRHTEDNGSFTIYNYDSETKHCISKLKGDNNSVVSRCFYMYDNLGFLSKTILDDGKSDSIDDLTGVTTRQMIVMQICPKGLATGQPLVVENKYLDLKTQKEVLIEKVIHTYSKNGNLIQKGFFDSNDQLRYYVHMNYDKKGELISTVDSRGDVVTAPKQESKYRLNEFKQNEAMIDQYGNETQYIYDDIGRITKTILPAIIDSHDNVINLETSQKYDIRNNVIESQDANGNVMQTEYNVRGKPTKITFSDGSIETFVYFLDGNLKESISKEGRKTIFERDAFGHVTRSEEWANDILLSHLEYNYQGSLLMWITDDKTFTTNFTYDGAGRQIGSRQVSKEGVKRREWSYDACGEKTVTKEWFRTSEKDYVSKIDEKDIWLQTVGIRIEDSSGTVQKKIETNVSKTDSVFSQDSSAKNERNQYVRQNETIDCYGKRNLTLYDALGRVESITIYDQFGLKISEKYLRHDGNGNQIQEKNIVLVKGQPIRTYTIAWSYDSLNRLILVREGLETPTPKLTSHQYNLSGQLVTITKPDGSTLNHVYDFAGRISRFTSSDGTIDYEYFYDEMHRLIKVADNVHGNSIDRSYNDFNDMIEENLGSNLILKHSYDLASRRTGLILPDGSSVKYQYSGALLQSVERFNRNQELLYHHDYEYSPHVGKLVKSHMIKDLGAISYTYDPQGRPRSIQSEWWSMEIPTGGLDANNCLTQMIIQDTTGETNQTYSYENNNQLQNEEGTFKNQFEYDSIYNRISQNEQEWSFNDLNQLIKNPNSDFQYDSNGNLIKKISGNTIFTYEYDALNRLSRVIKNQNVALQYIYDAFHRRIVQKTYNWDEENQNWVLAKTDRFIFDGDKEIGRADAEGKIIELRVLGAGKGAEIGTAVAFEFDEEIYAPIHDLQGSVRCLINANSRSVSEYYRYSAFGSEIIYAGAGYELDQSAIGNPWRFSSKRNDPFTNFIFFGRRYYDPSIGRWTTPDPLSFYDGPNLYTYVQNNPLTQCDLYGLFSISSVWDTLVNSFAAGWYYLKNSSNNAWGSLHTELGLTPEASDTFRRIGKQLLGESFIILMGYDCNHRSEVGSYGTGELNDKVRVTFINGILTTKSMLVENLELMSKTHGGINVHYIFRPTEGWTSDITKALAIKLTYNLGFRSLHAHLLANTWRRLIGEMGGSNSGGTIVHYAHSLGGSDTDRARELLTPEEQKMIRVISFGSPTMIRNEGFQSVINYVSLHDGVSNNFFIEPMGHIRNYFDPNSNVIFKNDLFSSPFFPFDHLLSGKTYRSILMELGDQFLIDFAPK